MTTRRLIERRDADQPMDTGFGRHQAKRVLAVQRERRALDPGFFARLVVEHLSLEAAALGPFQVHPQQHVGPVLRLGTAGTGMDRDDGTGAIVLAAEHLLDLCRFGFGLERVERLEEIRADVLALPRPFEQDAKVVDPPPE